MMMVGGGDAVGDGEGAEEEEEEGEEEEDGQFDLDWDEFLRNPSAFVMEAGQVVAREEGGGDETEEDVGDGDMEMADEYDDEDQDEEEEEDDITFLMGGLQVGQAPDGYQQVTQQMAEVQGTNGLDLAQYVVDEDVGEDARTKKLRDWFRPW